MAHQNNGSSLSEAVGRLVELGLTSNDRRDQQKLRARKMAGDAIDGMGDKATTEEARVSRKQDLLNGPAEFNRLRKDRPSTTSGSGEQVGSASKMNTRHVTREKRGIKP
ncbi:hypothetical protein JQ581_32060 [Bradyrhizobium liaoningense]|uniref:hypothetical protein n=1 Tax=Bradyrhizobium TaxID=374 RepID=UPI00140F024C|nr:MULTISPECIES: hypothetical protein [Bradyrhizobium]MBR0741578.1 hypothetical protein [Bradyrhizobium liaoningense]QIO32600.1 hypothetical protein HAP40_12705 [Bradyrhizobium sp. 1(2017)]